MKKTATIPWQPLSEKHKAYILRGMDARMCVAEGAIRSGKTIDHCIMAAAYLETCPDKIHLASGSTIANAKLNIGVCNGFGLENLFRGRCRWGKYKENQALFLATQTGEKIVVFTGGKNSDSYKRILGNSYGLWIATEINEHYDSDDSRESFVKVANGRQLAAVRPYTLWDMNPCSPRHPIYTEYIDKYRDNGMKGYVYEHFTIRDNLSISEERQAEITAQYDPKTVWYRRDILGERCTAEGLVYPSFADTPEKYIIDEPPPIIQYANIGVDFGGTKSGHAFTLTGFTPGYKDVVVLDEYYHNNTKEGRFNPDQLNAAFIDFVRRAQQRYKVAIARCDSAEQTLIEGLRSATKKAGVAIGIENAIKGAINDRIAFYNSLMAQERFKIMSHCKATIDALQTAIYDADKIDDERLDNGTTNIDSLDSMEYSTEVEQSSIMYIRR